MSDAITVRDERTDDPEALHRLHTLAFGQDAEARLVDALRDGGYACVSVVAEVEGEVVGHALFSRMTIRTRDEDVPALALAPVAVRPDHQSRGIGATVIRTGLDRCRELGHAIVIVVGHPDYYPRFGFRADLATALRSPYAGPALMALELQPAALTGVAGELIYAPPFAGL